METAEENYSVETVNNNSIKVDTAVGFEAVTSSTRPSAPYNGKPIRETDTGSVYFSNGSSPASGSWVPIVVASGPVLVGNVGASAPLRIHTTSTLSGNRLLEGRRSGETHVGFLVDFDGRWQWGPGGSTPPDTNLYRSAAGVLRTDNNLVVGTTRVTAPQRLRTTSFTTASGTTATAHTIATLSIPDPGYSYVVQLSGAAEIQSVAGTQTQVSIRLTSSAGSLVCAAGGSDGAYRHCVTPTAVWPKSGSLTGASTFVLVQDRMYGTGAMTTTAVLALFEALVIPA
ncbi:hypothetical protein [Saccharothrix xinjiangensis]|uniref:Uncharacterized protein n=1 Tax=Saccharothrix xinjiangensis TaxID=204798 RepID=A0ABV9XTL3_9PSEU